MNDKKMKDIGYKSSNFDVIPPIIGIIIGDQYGITIIVIEHKFTDDNHYGPIKSYLNEDDKNLIELEMVSMYFSSFKIFAGQSNIQNLSNLEIHGSNMKVQIYFLLEKYMVILFLNSNTQLSSREKTGIIRYFKDLLTKHEFAFSNYNDSGARKILKMLERKGKNWLKNFNNAHIQLYKRTYLKKIELLEKLIEEIDPIIRSELNEYFPRVPDVLVSGVSKEIQNKIQDKLFNQIKLSEGLFLKKKSQKSLPADMKAC